MTYAMKDSGDRETFASGAVRDVREGKGRYDLISPFALHRLAQVYERGAAKYAERNWERGIPVSRCLDSALRHLNQYRMGLRDEDHLAHAAWNLFAAMHFEAMVEHGGDPALVDHPVYVAQTNPMARPQCDAEMDGRRCDLIAGHVGPHGAGLGAQRILWPGPVPWPDSQAS